MSVAHQSSLDYVDPESISMMTLLENHQHGSNILKETSGAVLLGVAVFRHRVSILSEDGCFVYESNVHI